MDSGRGRRGAFDPIGSMKIEQRYSHLNGLEWLLVRRPAIWEEIEAVIGAVDATALKTKESKEVRKAEKLLYSPTELNRRFKEEFRALGWAESRTPYWVTHDDALIRQTVELGPDEQEARIKAAGQVPIASYNQTDFVKERVAVEVQFGKYSFIAYDTFVKHLAFYVRDQIDVGVEVLAMKSMQSEMSSGPGFYERGLYDIARQGRGVPAVPLVLIGVTP